jgi:phage terminase large subunit
MHESGFMSEAIAPRRARMQPLDLGYIARPQFVAFHKRPQRWACVVTHRRCGKTLASIMDLIDKALRHEKGQDAHYSYIAPTYSQAKDVCWSYLKRFTANVPRVEQRESELAVIFAHNGARVRLYGSDSFDRLRGGYNDGMVLDEYGDQDPRAWPEVLRPTLSDRRGWAVFIGTPRGRNHFHDIWNEARHSDSWFHLLLKASDTGLLPADELADLRRALTASQYAQELDCSFEVAVAGAVYGRELDEARNDGRITRVAHDPSLPVDVYFDLGFADHTAVWFVQHSQGEIRLIDHHEENGHAFPHYMQLLQARGYTYRTMWLPHDAKAKNLGTGRSVEEMARAAGWRVMIVKNLSIEDGINAARVLFANMWFDEVRCERGLLALRNYRFKADMAGTPVSREPVHNFASHSADALRMVAVAMQEHRRATYQSYEGPPRLRRSIRERGSVGWLRS